MTSDLDLIRSRHTRKGDVCTLDGLGWPCDAHRLAEDLALANEILETPMATDVDLSMTAGLIQLRGDSRVLADLDGDKADMLRDMLADLIGERDGIERPLVDKLWAEDWDSSEDAAQDLNIGIEPNERSPLPASSPQGTDAESGLFATGGVVSERVRVSADHSGCVFPPNARREDGAIEVVINPNLPFGATTAIAGDFSIFTKRRSPGGCEDEETA